MTETQHEDPRQTDRDHVAGRSLPVVTDDAMRERLGKSRPYTLVMLRRTARFIRPDVDATIWEHGRRNMALAEDGVLAVVCPITDESEWSGVGIFAASEQEADEIMAHDPGVLAGIFTYEIHPVRGFPGASLPA
ncbi:YciI family protein [Candidatus Solirubrobacter pratensis]|uniref:hypothetical protein n=1 Tax=Candidatus Solirubrobacter pratensis TaxID=1298857 RepID=UPI000401E6F5|nr:hypothetical protein [Candidatus Solirubrobacter pratensis]